MRRICERQELVDGLATLLEDHAEIVRIIEAADGQGKWQVFAAHLVEELERASVLSRSPAVTSEH